MSTATGLSRITGFVRIWATGFALGIAGLTAAYDVANNVPNMIFEFVAGGILSSLFIPTFLELKAERGEAAAWRFASHVFNLSVIALGVLAVVGTLWPEPFIWTQTFRLSGDRAVAVRSSAEFFFRFFAVQVMLYGGGMVVQGLLNAQRKYLWAALGPVFNNLVVIGTMFAYHFIRPSDPDLALIVLAVGTTLGVLAMFAVMVPDLARGGIRYTAELGLHDPAVRKMLVLAVPTVLYVVTNLVAVSFRNASAFAVTEKGPAILRFAWQFFQLPYGILAVALATAVFTELADAAGRKDIAELKTQFGKGLRATGVLMLPAAALLIALAEPLVSLYRVGAFQASDVPAVASALRLWGAGLVFFACMMFVLRTFYSLKDTRTPMLANLALTPVQIGLYTLLTTGAFGWSGLGIDGIPISDGVFYALLLAALVVLLRRRIGGFDLKGVGSTFLRMGAASAIAGVAAYAIARLLAPPVPEFAPAVLQLVVAGTAGVVVALVAGKVFGVAEIGVAAEMARRVGRRVTQGRRESQR